MNPTDTAREIVGQLREQAVAAASAQWADVKPDQTLEWEAADEIERLSAAIAAERGKVIETCAKLAESKSVHGLGNTAYDNAYDDAASDIAAAIRKLRSDHLPPSTLKDRGR